jgi:hypothetical protein
MIGQGEAEEDTQETEAATMPARRRRTWHPTKTTPRLRRSARGSPPPRLSWTRNAPPPRRRPPSRSPRGPRPRHPPSGRRRHPRHLKRRRKIPTWIPWTHSWRRPSTRRCDAARRRRLRSSARPCYDARVEIKVARESGKEVKARADATMLEDIDAETEDRPDECIELPDNKVKLVIGAGGENIKRIQKKSNCRLQVRKKSKDMSIGFGGTDQGGLMREGGGADTAAQPDDVAGVTVFMLFGDADARAVAKRMIHELFDKAANAKFKQRQDEKDYKAKKRERARREYHLRHKKDYDVLGVPLGAPKDECKRAYRKLAVKWHPDKHPAGDGRVAAEAKFKEIQRAFDALMTTDEEQTIEALTAKGQKDAERAAKVSLFLFSPYGQIY